MKKEKRLLIVTNVDWFLISHRLILAQAAIKNGWSVYVACEDTGRGHEISNEGITFINFPFSRSGTNLIEEFKLYRRFRKLYKTIKPDVIHHITIKPVVYGSLAAKAEKIKGVVNAISGLGYMFAKGNIGIMQRMILLLLRKGASFPNVSFIFQNNEDKNILNDFSVLNNCKSVDLIKGSGVDLEKYPLTFLDSTEVIKLLLPCRMLWDKGVREFIEAAEILRDKYSNKLQFILVGKAEDNNKSAVPRSYLDESCDGNYIVWKGHINDVIDEYKKSHIVVLPSYREGLPKSLIEACAIGRPIITTNAIGCKDCVDEGVNGYKINVGSSEELAKAIEIMVEDFDKMKKMGIAGRYKAEKEFDVNDVINKHLDIYNSY